jgi:hypothetical protein
MQDPHKVMSLAFEGNVQEVCTELGVTDKRIYDILARNDPYTKLWRMLNPLGRVAPESLRLVVADFNARADRILGDRGEPSTPASLHRELSDAVDAVLAKKPAAEQKREILEAIAELQKRLATSEET